MRRIRRFVLMAGLALVLVSGALSWPRLVGADQAPMWDSPVGLTPGQAGSQVRMVAETVDIPVVERDRNVNAVVLAVFDMLNQGPDVTMKVGFPSFTFPIIRQALGSEAETYSPVTFNPVNLTAFRVWTDEREYQASVQEVGPGTAGTAASGTSGR